MQQSTTVVTLSKLITPQAMQQCLQFIYTGSLDKRYHDLQVRCVGRIIYAGNYTRGLLKFSCLIDAITCVDRFFLHHYCIEKKTFIYNFYIINVYNNLNKFCTFPFKLYK